MSEKIELSLSPKYVSNWGLREAVREILQNAIDAQTDGAAVDVTYLSKCLTIKTIGASIPKSTLLLGESGKNDSRYVGKYGEGYKLALLVLTRIGKTTHIYTGGERWTPIFERSDTFGEQILKLCIEPSDSFQDDCVAFQINDIEQHEMQSFRDDFIALERFLGREVGATRESEYGIVLLNKEYKGRFYVNGLYVQTDTEFRYGYDFKAEYVDLDRDRKAINYYDLRELTAQALASCGDVELLEDGIQRNIVDLRNSDAVLSTLSDDQSLNFKHHYFEKYGLPEDTVVGTKRMVEIIHAEHTHEDVEVVSRIVFRADDKEDEFHELKRKVKAKDDYDGAVIAFDKSAYKKLYVWLRDNGGRLSKKAKDEFMDILDRDVAKPYGFDVIKEDVQEIIEMGL